MVYLVRLGDVRRHTEHLIAQLSLRCLKVRLLAATDGHLRPLIDEPLGQGQTNAAAAPRNEHSLS